MNWLRETARKEPCIQFSSIRMIFLFCSSRELALPWLKHREVFLHPACLARLRFPRTRRGGLSRSVAYSRWSTRFHMSYGTV